MAGPALRRGYRPFLDLELLERRIPLNPPSRLVISISAIFDTCRFRDGYRNGVENHQEVLKQRDTSGQEPGPSLIYNQSSVWRAR